MKRCGNCQARADFRCLECGVYYCYDDIFKTRVAFAAGCGSLPGDNHIYIPIIQKEMLFMAITNEAEAYKEGQRMGLAFNAMCGGADPGVDVGALNYLARKFAKWENLGNVDLNYTYVDGFVEGFTHGPAQKQLGPAVGGE